MTRWHYMIFLFFSCRLLLASTEILYRSRSGLGIQTTFASSIYSLEAVWQSPNHFVCGIIEKNVPLAGTHTFIQDGAFAIDSLPTIIDTIRVSASLNFVDAEEKILVQRSEIGERYHYTPVDSLFCGADLTFNFSIRKLDIDFFGRLLVITDSDEARARFEQLSDEQQARLRRTMMNLPALFEDYEEQLYIKYYPYGFNEAVRRRPFQWRQKH